jgi:hypothetical protein
MIAALLLVMQTSASALDPPVQKATEREATLMKTVQDTIPLDPPYGMLDARGKAWIEREQENLIAEGLFKETLFRSGFDPDQLDGGEKVLFSAASFYSEGLTTTGRFGTLRYRLHLPPAERFFTPARTATVSFEAALPGVPVTAVGNWDPLGGSGESFWLRYTLRLGRGGRRNTAQKAVSYRHAPSSP